MKTALLVIDVQESFRHLPFWTDEEVPQFLERLNGLIERCQALAVPVLQVFHVQEASRLEGVFARESGLVAALSGLRLGQAPTQPEAAHVFYKSVHSAMFASNASGQNVDLWLRAHGIERLIVTGIRTEQCCETTTRHASDLGYRVSYATDATLTFPMTSTTGRRFSTAEIRERTELVLAGRFAEVRRAGSIEL